ncbi:putative DNA helicase [Tanacetum coccineum]|uniref:ATP-dependent DNA helicase n=1 Tax=Tanacetum coccineum TaxID=301880 RepID=A0ABQ4WQZ5_9ASTR
MANIGGLPNNFVNETTVALKKRKRKENLKNWKWEDVIVIDDVDVPNEVAETDNNAEVKEEHVTVDIPNQHVTHKMLLSLFFIIVFIFRICEVTKYNFTCRMLKMMMMSHRHRSIAVERLPFHEEGRTRVYFRDDDDVENVLERATNAMSRFTGWMRANMIYPEGRHLLYADYPTKFTWHASDKEWRPRKSGMSIGRIYYVPPSMGEIYYLRMLLNHVPGATSHIFIRTVDNIVYPTYISACKALNLLGDDIEWIRSIREASQWKLGDQLRELFVTILLFCTVSDHAKLFRDTFPYISEDISSKHRRSLLDFSQLPQIDYSLMNIGRNRLIAAERMYNMTEELAWFTTLYVEVQGKRTCGEQLSHGYVQWENLCCLSLHLALNFVTPGGRTAHSRIHIPLELDNESCCGIDVVSDLACLIREASLIISDEAPLQHRHAFEAVDRTFRDYICCLKI